MLEVIDYERPAHGPAQWASPWASTSQWASQLFCVATHGYGQPWQAMAMACQQYWQDLVLLNVLLDQRHLLNRDRKC